MSTTADKDPNGINQHSAGAKLDAGKVDMSLLTLWPRALTEVCRVGTLGARKYSRGGFLSVADGYIRYTAALLRHLFKEASGQLYDDDSYYETPEGAPFKNTIRHDAQVAWNALSRLEVKLIEEEKNKHEQQGIVWAIDPTGANPPIQVRGAELRRGELAGSAALAGQSGAGCPVVGPGYTAYYDPHIQYSRDS